MFNPQTPSHPAPRSRPTLTPKSLSTFWVLEGLGMGEGSRNCSNRDIFTLLIHGNTRSSSVRKPTIKRAVKRVFFEEGKRFPFPWVFLKSRFVIDHQFTHRRPQVRSAVQVHCRAWIHACIHISPPSICQRLALRLWKCLSICFSAWMYTASLLIRFLAFPLKWQTIVTHIFNQFPRLNGLSSRLSGQEALEKYALAGNAVCECHAPWIFP